MRAIVLLVIVLTACAGQQGDDPVMQSPEPSPAPATEEPLAPGEDGTPGEDLLTGTLGGDAQLEGGCAWIDDGGRRWEVLYPEGYRVTFDPVTLHGPDGPIAEEGATITVPGSPQDDVMTVCQVGPVWQATDVRVGG